MMFHLRTARGPRRRALLALGLVLTAGLALTGPAPAAGPGGWDHLGLSPTAGPSLNAATRAFAPGPSGVLYVGGSFTDAAGIADADRIAAWNGSAWTAVAPGIDDGAVNAIVYAGGKVYAGGTFHNAGGNANADFLAVWDGVSWAPFCNPATPGPSFAANVDALQVIGSTLFVGGEYQNGAGLASADYLLACDLDTGDSSTTVAGNGLSGAVYALTADANGTLYAAGTFINVDGIAAADYVASYDGSWQAMGSGSPNGGAVNGISRALTASGTDVYVGTDATDVAGIPQADHVARWNGSAWSAVGSDTAGANGWLPTTASINAMTTSGTGLFVAGSFQNANGDPAADNVAAFGVLGSGWTPVGSNGAGNGPWIGNGLALGIFNQAVYAGGSFTSAGGDTQASFAAFYPLGGTVAGPGSPASPAAPLPPPITPEPPVPPLPDGTLPPPTLGETVNAVPESGVVLVKVPASAARAGAARGTATAAAATFVPLAEARQVPLGSTFDTTRGTVRLTLATRRAGATQAGHFSQGRFVTAQSKASGLSTMSATGGGLRGCATRLSKGGAPKVQAARRRRSLFSNARGRFRTRGRSSSATVRGTAWLQKDTCAGTLTVVKSGSVAVRDLAKRRTVVVKRGQRYFARAPRKGGAR